MKKIFISIIKIYQVFFSCLFVSSCRFYPTCSNYAILAIKKYGCFKSIFYIVFRIIKCHPFCKGGINHLN
jgi:hypothetical protein